ncbi:HNH endonuclease family protein, partial [Agrobacterium sp. MAFF310724]
RPETYLKGGSNLGGNTGSVLSGNQQQDNWPIPGFEHLDDAAKDLDIDFVNRRSERDAIIDRLGNLTLLTQSLNSSVSNGPYSIKMPAVRSHSSLALNRELHSYDDWNEKTVAVRGNALFNTALKIWAGPVNMDATQLVAREDASPFPAEGTLCKFTYAGNQYDGQIQGAYLVVQGYEMPFGSFSAASKTISQTNRNGWNDWFLQDSAGGWISANDWRQALQKPT